MTAIVTVRKDPQERRFTVSDFGGDIVTLFGPDSWIAWIIGQLAEFRALPETAEPRP